MATIGPALNAILIVQSFGCIPPIEVTCDDKKQRIDEFKWASKPIGSAAGNILTFTLDRTRSPQAGDDTCHLSIATRSASNPDPSETQALMFDATGSCVAACLESGAVSISLATTPVVQTIIVNFSDDFTIWVQYPGGITPELYPVAGK